MTQGRLPGGALLAPGMLLLIAAAAAAQKPAQRPPQKPAAEALTATVTGPARVKRGAPAALTVSLTDKTLSAANAVIDLEVYNAQNKRVGQNVWQGQTLTRGKAGSYHWTWKPTTAGAYTVKLGVFGAGWKPLYHWNDKALALAVA